MADPFRFSHWSTLEFMGCAGEVPPSAGDVLHARFRSRSAANKALHFEFVEWVSGSRHHCSIFPGRAANGKEMEVRVHSEIESVGACARVQHIYCADIPRWATSSYRLVGQRRLRRALESLAHRFAS